MARAPRFAARGGADVKVFVDTAPVMEKPLAAAAGLELQTATRLVRRLLDAGAVVPAHGHHGLAWCGGCCSRGGFGCSSVGIRISRRRFTFRSILRR